ncbi:MAG: nicotinate-nucleotide adenylyltransferase [Pontibacterium sp.]
MNDAVVFMGGTFDPIHNGHLRTALEIQQWLNVEQVRLVPSKSPVHRGEPGCTSEQRLAMVRQSVENEAALVADAREVESEQLSYTWLTLQSLRQEIGEQRPLCLVMGMDVYLSLSGWHQWQHFLDYCHIIVVARPGYQFAPDDTMARYTALHAVTDKHCLLQNPCGHVLIHEMTLLGISATQIRRLVASDQSPRYLLPDPVWTYIKKHNLYGYHTN